MLKSKSKSFKYVNENEVIAKVLNDQGAYCVLPSSFAYHDVLVIVEYPQKCEFMYTMAKKINTRTFVPLPRIYTSKNVRVRIVEQPKSISVIDPLIIMDEIRESMKDKYSEYDYMT